jgi:outer membrane protein TolC
MSDTRKLLVAALAALTVGLPAGAGEPEPERIVSSAEVVELAARGNPTLAAALLERRRAAAEVTAEEGRRPFTLQLDGGYTHSSSPAVGQSGTVSHRTGDQLGVGGQVSKTTAVGTQAQVRVEGASQLDADPETTYGLSARLSLTQPLLRGAGREIGEAGLRQARVSEDAARRSARRSASALTRDVLQAYWELWYAARGLAIDERARDLARAVLDEARQRIAQGAAAEIDVLQYETRLSSLEETVVAAESSKRRLAVQLAALTGLGREPVRLAPDLAESPPLAEADPPPDRVLREALERSPEIRSSASSVTAAEERARTAGEELRQRLDLVGWIGAQTLGSGEVSPALAQFGDGTAYAGYVGLVYELPLDDTRKEAQHASARLDVETARQRLVATSDQVRADVAVALEKLRGARRRLALSGQTLEAARKLAAAERERHALGASIHLQVRDAEESERQAEHRLVRARVDLALALIELDHLTGALLGD